MKTVAAKFLIGIALVTTLAACAKDVRNRLIGNWKFVSAAEPENPVFPTAHFMKTITDAGYYTFIDSVRTGMITGRGDTVNPFKYDVRNDTMIVHTKGLDVFQKFGFIGEDTLILETQGTAEKYVRMKTTKR